MNGAYDGEMRQVVEESLCIDKDGWITLKAMNTIFL